jgi:hypothetical protein
MKIVVAITHALGFIGYIGGTKKNQKERTNKMNNQFLRFSAYNTEAQYGFGTSVEAERYCAFLNRKREINTYSYQEVTDKDEVEKLKKRSDLMRLDEELGAIADGTRETE